MEIKNGITYRGPRGPLLCDLLGDRVGTIDGIKHKICVLYFSASKHSVDQAEPIATCGTYMPDGKLNEKEKWQVPINDLLEMLGVEELKPVGGGKVFRQTSREAIKASPPKTKKRRVK